MKVLGEVVPDADPDAPGEFASGDVPRLADAVGDALADADAFEASFSRLNLFPTVAYAEVDDDGAFAALNDRLCDLPDVPVYDRDRDGFVPHCTLGQFASADGFYAVVDHLEANRELDAGPVAVDELELATYDYDGRWPTQDVVRTYALD